MVTGMATSGVTTIHVEAPPRDLDVLVERSLLDRVIVFVVPTLGGTPPGVVSGGLPLDDPAVAARRAVCPSALRSVSFERFGDTVLVTGYLPGGAGGHQADGKDP